MAERGALTGRIIEFLDGDRLRLAVVTRHSGEKLQVTDANGKQRRLARRQVVIAHTESSEPDAFPARAATLLEEIEAARSDVDTELLWESAREEGRDLDLAELAASYFGEAGAVGRSAVYRAILEDPVRFKVRGAAISPRTAEQVAEQLHAVRAREAKEALRRRAAEWAAAALASPEPSIAVPDELAPAVDALEDALLGRRLETLREWLGAAPAGLAPEQAAFALLVRCGRLPGDADARLILAGARDAFPTNVLEEAEALAPYVEESAREDFSDLPAFTIDDEDTREVDDAITVEEAGETVRVGIHIADVASFVSKDSALDREAFRRGATLYLPYRNVPMLPERLSHDLASLVQGELRPSLGAVVEIDREGALRRWRIVRGQVRVARRLTYEAADEVLAGGEGALGHALARLDDFARRLESERRSRGALTIRRPELKVTSRDGRIAVKVIDGSSPSRRIVSELMILSNRLAAEHAAASGLPIIFRAQDPPAEPVEQPETYDPVAIDRIFRLLSRSRFSLAPQRHAGLGLDAYTQLTSPLRRFQDLVIQRQVAARLAGEPLPYSQQELFEALGTAEAAEAENRAIESDANREYVLRWLEERLAGRDEGAVVVAVIAGGCVVELESVPVRGKLLAGAGLVPGDRVRVRIEAVNPGKGDLLLRPA